ncbi:hypothetical protein PLEOSDRAFT_156091 [Pleurotus ostreatus PC15]|uniref:Uncharacterized protein n=1 Tax=Pleurotus ostreatus (strain PC15) TaxID=1137138 RepID=A0A067P6B6_PLEO1|nr:hypothetical protein PLEOSDRAFT_156091 [Pleurotus ostreatus PC15]
MDERTHDAGYDVMDKAPSANFTYTASPPRGDRENTLALACTLKIGTDREPPDAARETARMVM